MAKTVIVYHANCWDGIVAAWAIVNKLPNPEQAILLPRNPSEGFDEEVLVAAFGADAVYYVDISTHTLNLEALCKVAKNVIMLDHHKSARDDVRAYIADKQHTPPTNLHIRFDMSRSGATLAWDFANFPAHRLASEDRLGWGQSNVENPLFFSRPALVPYVQDRDLWLWRLPSSKEISAFIDSFPKTLKSCCDLEQAKGH